MFWLAVLLTALLLFAIKWYQSALVDTDIKKGKKGGMFFLLLSLSRKIHKSYYFFLCFVINMNNSRLGLTISQIVI